MIFLGGTHLRGAPVGAAETMEVPVQEEDPDPTEAERDDLGRE